jgi:reactive chlorine resistance protein C
MHNSTVSQQNQTASDNGCVQRINRLGIHVTRYGLAIVMIWIGAMKFTQYEAAGIQPLVANSPLMSWLYDLMSVQGFSNLLGAVEITVGLMIALRPVSAKLSAIGSLATAPMFLGTLSFIFSTPGWESTLGFPALSVVPGQFLLKDIVLLGAALVTAAEALESCPRSSPISVSNAD